MNKQILSENLERTVFEFRKNYEFQECEFMVEPVIEKDKPRNSRDDFMRLNVLSERNIGGKRMSLRSAIDLLGAMQPMVPIWVDVLLVECQGGTALFLLKCSVRFRKPSLLRHAETGHPPFRAVLGEE